MPARESADTSPGGACAATDPGAGGAGEGSGPSRGGGKPLIHPHRHNLKNRFELIRTLGEGTYGKVKLALEKSTGEQVAIKYVKKTKIRDDTDLNRIRREIQILSRLRHTNIVNIRQVFEKKDRIVLVMDCALGGELYDYLNTKRCLPEAETRRIFRQIIAAMHYIHQNGIVHRDLKLENIILDSEGNVKIADFGLANYYNHNSALHTFCGSPLYASPEIVNGKPYHGPEVDIWSLGVVLYTLAYGAMPFESTNLSVLRQQISSGQYAEPKQPCGAASLIRHMLTVTPARRATVEHILQHWWVNLSHDVTPDGRPYEPLPLPVPAHRHQGVFFSDGDVEQDSRCPPPGLHHTPGARIGRKSAETSFDEDEMLYDIGTSATSPSPTSAVPASPVNGVSMNGYSTNGLSMHSQSSDGLTTNGQVGNGLSLNDQPGSKAGEEKLSRNRHWSQTIAIKIDEIKARVMQSLAADEGPQTAMEKEKTSFVFTYDKDSCSDSDRNEDADKTSVFTTEQTINSDGERQNVFDSDRKPRRGILKRKGKFSGGDSGCCIMADDASSPKLEEEESPSSKLTPSDLCSSPVPPALTFPKDLAASASVALQNQPMASWFAPLQDECSAPPPVGTSVPVNQCPVHRYPTSNTLPASSHSLPNTLPYAPTSGQPQAHSPSTQPSEGQISPNPDSPLNHSHNQTLPLPGALTNAACTCTYDLDLTKVVRRRKGILKNPGAGGGSNSARNSLIEDARKRLSLGSLSSNSSADILDLSYDSGDGEQMITTLPQYPAMSARSMGGLVLEAGDRNSFSLDGEFTALSLEGIAASAPRLPLEYNVALNPLAHADSTGVCMRKGVSCDCMHKRGDTAARDACRPLDNDVCLDAVPDSQSPQPQLNYNVTLDTTCISASDQCHAPVYSEFDYAEARAVCQQALSLINTQ